MATNGVTNILLVGVGGQGIIIVSDILALALMKHGYDVKKSEVHGMAQRGGSVSSHVRFGQKVYSPLIKDRETDIMFAAEEMEALRYLQYLRKDSLILLNKHQVNPPAVFLGKASYLQDVPEKLKDVAEVRTVDGPSMANQLGNSRVANIIILGQLANSLDVSNEAWIEAIKEILPPKLHEINEKAFLLGREQI